MTEVLTDEILQDTLDQNLFYRILEGDARNRLADLENNSVHLIITSPPYGTIKNYSDKETEIGFDQSFQEYHHALMEVFRECVRVLHPGCRMVINIGDEFVKSSSNKPYHIMPHSSEIISNLLNEFPDDLIYNGTIHWRKCTTSNTSGGGKIMGSVYHPRNGHFFVNYEHVIVFKKLGNGPKPEKWRKRESKFTLDERRKWFSDLWEFPPVRQDDHIAMFPMELPERLIQMYSFVGETVLDPFVGSGTTLAAAAKTNRSGIGIDIGFTSDNTWKDVIRTKISPYSSSSQTEFK